MQRRGRILQLLQSRVSGDQQAQRAEGQLSPPSQPEPVEGIFQQSDPSGQELTKQETSPTPVRATVSRPARGRGAILRHLASLRSSAQECVGNDEANTIKKTEDASENIRPTSELPSSTQASTQLDTQRASSEDRNSSSSGNAPPSRRDSSASRSSILSQHFTDAAPDTVRSFMPKVQSSGGTPVQLSCNYVTFNTGDQPIEQYHVDFNPNIESIRLRSSVFRTEQALEVLGSVSSYTGTNLYLPKRLPSKVTDINCTHPVTGNLLRIRLTHTKTPPPEELLPFYNNLMHRVLTRLRYVIFNRQHYSPDLKISVPDHKLEVWPGWVTSVQRLDGGLKLSIDSSFKVVRLETIHDILVNLKNRLRGGNLKELFEQQLVGSIVMTRYNNKPYRIDGFEIGKKASDIYFTSRNGSRSISMIDYLREHWNYEVRDPNQPLIINRPKPKFGQESDDVIYLLPETCVPTGLTDEMRANYTVMKAVGDHTRLPPDIREAKLSEFLHQISTDERASSVLSQWNLSVRQELDVVKGRRLDTETIWFGNNRSHKVADNVDWTRPATTWGVFKSVDINNWVLMHTERDSPAAHELLENIRQVSQTLGIKFSKPRIVKLQNDSAASYVNAAKSEVNSSDQMVVILTPGKSQREDRYSACKRLLSCDMPIPCQFIRCGTIMGKKIRSVCQKVVIQILSKVGGQPWAMKLPIKSFMIVGIDTYHDTIDRKKSCVGFVASMNEFASSWWSRTFFQNSLEEIGFKILSTLVAALRRFHQLNGFMPQKIIVYRDGVGDSQLDTVIQCEVTQAIRGVNVYMRDEHASLPEPQMSYVIVQKRLSAKLSLRNGNRVMNPLPGTYLDHNITHPDYNDFYLVSQHVNQGTVSPTKYVLISETGNLKLEHHQKLAYKMTHMYYNWCGTIRVPAPCQYAHKLAYLTGENIRQPASERLEDKLFYL